jgi:hypothetical protein
VSFGRLRPLLFMLITRGASILAMVIAMAMSTVSLKAISTESVWYVEESEMVPFLNLDVVK